MPEGVHLRATGSTLGERKHSERGNLLDPRSIIRVTNYHPPTHMWGPSRLPGSQWTETRVPSRWSSLLTKYRIRAVFAFLWSFSYGVNCQNCSNLILKINDFEKFLEILIRKLLIKKNFSGTNWSNSSINYGN